MTTNYIGWIVGLLILLTTPAPAQRLAVEYVSGDVGYALNRTEKPRPLKVQYPVGFIRLDGWLTLGPAAVIHLRPENNRVMYVISHRVGHYQLKSLLDQPLTTEVSAALTDFFSTLWHDFSDDADSRELYAKRFRQKGIVSRGETDSCAPALLLTPDFNANLRDTLTTFRWGSQPAAHRYTLALHDSKLPTAQPLYTTSVADTVLAIDLRLLPLKRNTTYYWSASPTDKPTCARFDFRLPDEATLQEIDEGIAVLRKQLPGDPALATLLAAAEYEKQRLFIDAQRAYETAYRQEPTGQLYRKSLGQFLSRRGLVGPDRQVLASPR